MHIIGERIVRLIIATALIPVGGWLAYFVARYIDGDPDVIGHNGSSLGVFIAIGSLFFISHVAKPKGYTDRAGISLILSAVYFLASWLLFGDPASSVDAAPHIIWYGACVVAFTPVVVIMPASDMAWSSLRRRRKNL